jgi:AcrR family transcriptional regulator
VKERNGIVSTLEDRHVSIVEVERDSAKARPTGPRAEARERTILEAALELLMEVGYDRLSMDALAERARAGKGTIYRHWSGKAQVVAAAVKQLKCDKLQPFPDNGSLRGDLLAALLQIASSVADSDSAIITGVMSAMRTDPELAELVQTQILDSKKGEFDGIVERAVRRGELPDGSAADLLDEVVPAILFFRMTIQGRPIDETFAHHVVDDIVMPLLDR